MSKKQRGSCKRRLAFAVRWSLDFWVLPWVETCDGCIFVYGGSVLLLLSCSQGTQEQSTLVQVQPQAGAPYVRGGGHGQAAEDYQGAFEASIGRGAVGR